MALNRFQGTPYWDSTLSEVYSDGWDEGAGDMLAFFTEGTPEELERARAHYSRIAGIPNPTDNPIKRVRRKPKTSE